MYKLIPLTFSIFATYSHAVESPKQELELSLPGKSNNGAFILRVARGASDTRDVQLWRSYNDSDFVQVTDVKFDALSQVVYKPGTYRYQLRGATAAEQIQSNIAIIEVKTHSSGK